MIHQGDVRDVLPTLDAESVQCVVTSPPYWGLRDYGVTGQIGLEPTPDDYAQTMVKVFREVKRVLRDDGTVWLNLGDSYAGSWGNYGGKNRGQGGQRPVNVGSLPAPAWDGRENERPAASRQQNGLKPKDLVGIPWRVAFALQAEGWYLRSDIIWAKGVSFCDSYAGTVMPESVTDRPTKSHEYLFLLTKSPRYYYDADAVRESGTGRDWSKVGGNLMGKGTHRRHDGYINIDRTERESATGRNLRSVWTINSKPYREAHFATFPTALVEPCVKAGSKSGDLILDPFAGSGTVGCVALKLGREFVGIELNPDYCTLARESIEGPLFAR